MNHLKVIKGGEAMGMGLADYIWLNDDGELQFKKRSILIGKDAKGEPVPLVERWTFQYTEHDVDCVIDETGTTWSCSCKDLDHTSRILVPCFFLPDPTRPQPSYIVLCEVRDVDDECVKSNTRAKLRQAFDARGKQTNLVWFGFEQDYTHSEIGSAEENGFEARRFKSAERHIGAMFDAGLMFHNAWNSPGQEKWDFKIGYRGFPQDLDPHPPNALIVSDHVVIARYLMEKICASDGLYAHWINIAAYVSTPVLRELGNHNGLEAQNIEMACAGIGETRKLSLPTRPEWQCVEICLDKASDPYALAFDVLNAVWPLENKPEPE